MIKWPWKTNEAGRDVALPWDDALTIPVLANLNPDEQSKLVQLADRFLQQKRLVPLQGFELDPLKNARIALLFCLPVKQKRKPLRAFFFICSISSSVILILV